MKMKHLRTGFLLLFMNPHPLAGLAPRPRVLHRLRAQPGSHRVLRRGARPQAVAREEQDQDEEGRGGQGRRRSEGLLTVLEEFWNITYDM